MDYPKLVLLAINWYGKRTFTLNRFAFDCCSLTDVASDSVVAVFVFGFSFILITLILRRWTLAYRITDLLLYSSDLYPLHSSFFSHSRLVTYIDEKDTLTDPKIFQSCTVALVDD